MTRKHLFSLTIALYSMTLWLSSCQIFSPENGKTQTTTEDHSEIVPTQKESSEKADSVIETKSEINDSTNEKDIIVRGITEEEGIPHSEDAKKECVKEAPVPAVAVESLVKCVEISSACYTFSHSDAYMAPSAFAPITLGGITSTSSFESRSETVYEEPRTVEGAAPSSAAGFTSDMAGKLTAGEINDFDKWDMWQDIAVEELEAYSDIWKINCEDRYSVFVQTKSGNPITDVIVKLKNKEGSVLWQTKTDNNGRAELWGQFEKHDAKNKNCVIEVIHRENVHTLNHPKSFRNGVNMMKIDAVCDIPNIADIAFTVDATGSMGDEISYLQAELVDVMNKVKNKHKDIELRLGSVFYRDFGDAYVTMNSDLDADLEITREFIAAQYADGGGDGPEAVEEALEASNKLSWSKTARARLMFLILDAPPHGDEVVIKKIQKQTEAAAKAGIRIIPIVASGGGYDLDKSLEYLMRSCALATNGTYVFLTDHSGIGNSHTAPSTDDYKVETLNELLLRVISQYLYVPDCDAEQFINDQEIADTSQVITQILPVPMDTLPNDSISIPVEPIDIFTMKCYPNPASQYFMAETSLQVEEMFLADNNGKIIERITPTSTLTRVEVADLPTGVYHLKAWINEKWASTRIVVIKI